MNASDILCKVVNVIGGACACHVATKMLDACLPELAIHPVVKKIGIFAIGSCVSTFAGAAVESDAKAIFSFVEETAKDLKKLNEKEDADAGDPKSAEQQS